MLHPIDIITKDNRFSGKTATPDEATRRGAWHRGAHAIIITPSGRTLVQRRSHNSMEFPDRLDIGVGGFVDSGETPEHTIIRETREETGLHITQSQLVFLGTSRRTYRWHFKHELRVSRAIIYNYVVRLDSEHQHLVPEKSEVDWIGFIPFKSALWLTHAGSLKRLGKLLPMYSYYRRTFRQAARFIHI